MATLTAKVLAPNEGLRLQSGPGRNLVFKVTGEDTGGAFDYFVVEVAPHGGPPLHVHHLQEETIHVLTGTYKSQIGDESFRLGEGASRTFPRVSPTHSSTSRMSRVRSSSSTRPAGAIGSTRSWVRSRTTGRPIEQRSRPSSRSTA